MKLGRSSWVVPVLSFVLAVALSTVVGGAPSLVRSLRLAQAATDCNATATVTALAANGNKWTMTVTNQPVTGTWNKEVNLKVRASVLVRATNVEAIDKNN
jgi:hypothetical protein